MKDLRSWRGIVRRQRIAAAVRQAVGSGPAVGCGRCHAQSLRQPDERRLPPTPRALAPPQQTESCAPRGSLQAPAPLASVRPSTIRQEIERLPRLLCERAFPVVALPATCLPVRSLPTASATIPSDRPLARKSAPPWHRDRRCRDDTQT